MKTVLTLGMIYGVDPPTACLFKQLFAKYLLESFLMAFMSPSAKLQLDNAELATQDDINSDELDYGV